VALTAFVVCCVLLVFVVDVLFSHNALYGASSCIL